MAERSIQDYIVDHQELDWDALLEGWQWMLPESFTVWLMNRFGDLFLIADDGSVLMLDVGMGRVEHVAENQNHFCDLCEDPENLSDWFAIPLVDALQEAGTELEAGQCFTFRHPPVTGGEYTVENSAATSIENQYAGMGAVHSQVRDVPDGREVELQWAP